MANRMKFDETGDSDDLQALFDSIASAPAEKPKLEVIAAQADSSGDDDELQALFDAVADEFETAAADAEVPPSAPPSLRWMRITPTSASAMIRWITSNTVLISFLAPGSAGVQTPPPAV